MKRKLLMFAFVALFLFSFAFAQTITSIADIQDTTGTGSPDSPLNGQVVTVSGIVTAELQGDNKANGGISDYYFWIQDNEALWSGIKVVYSDSLIAEGDSISICGTVEENYNQTQIKDVTSYTLHESGCKLPKALEVITAQAASEPYEGCLVCVKDVKISETNIGSYGEWRVDDNSGPIQISTRAIFYYTPVLDDSVKSISGIVMYDYGEYKLSPRLAYDIVEAGEYTRLQRIQQVRNSDLLKTPTDTESDISYLDGDTMKVKGIVTMPTGLSYAGAGIKFIFGEPGGGPWSAILSYHADSTAYPVLYEGDEIEMSGYIGEYTTASSNMTEFWITGPINILNIGQPLPPVDTIATGDLRLPVTAEQWGNVMIAVKDAFVIDVNPQYELFSVDDGTGEILIDDDSDSLIGYIDPPVGAVFESIKGWVYHHYGSYTDSNTYVLEPLYVEDLVLGSGPPQLANVSRNPGVPTSSDPVEVSVDVTTNATIDSVTIWYTIDGGEYIHTAMSFLEGDIWTGTIPQQSDCAWVDYYIVATDDIGLTSTMPADTSVLFYSYVVRDAGLTISDVQYTPWSLADSPFNGYEVTVSGIVTADTAFKANYGAYVIQDGAGPWNGIYIFGTDDILLRGDEVQVWGTVDDYNADWHFKWDNNTVILVDSVKILSSGNAEPSPVVLTTAELSGDSETAEQYEGVLVKVANAQVTAINPYDWSIDDGSGPCLLDDDASSIDAWFDSLEVNDVISQVTGVFTFSFGTYKIEVRDIEDVGPIVGIAEEPINYPLTYSLKQNFPNPFNPETRIYFEIPNQEHISIVIYNILGQKIRNLAMDTYPAGKHILNWNGRNDNGELVSSGTYIVRMKAGNYIDSKKMLLIR